jgi:hypothetical protein
MILKVSAPFIVSPLSYIFNRIIDSGIYPFWDILLLAKLSSLLRLVEVDIFSLLRFSTQEVKNLLKAFAISIELSTFRSFSVTITLRSFSYTMLDWRRRNKCQFYSIWFDLIRPRHEATIDRTQDQHARHYTNNVVHRLCRIPKSLHVKEYDVLLE